MIITGELRIYLDNSSKKFYSRSDIEADINQMLQAEVDKPGLWHSVALDYLQTIKAQAAQITDDDVLAYLMQR